MLILHSFLSLFNPGDNQALLNYCGADQEKVFRRELLDLFSPVFKNKYYYTINKKDNKEIGGVPPVTTTNTLTSQEWKMEGKANSRSRCHLLPWNDPLLV